MMSVLHRLDFPLLILYRHGAYTYWWSSLAHLIYAPDLYAILRLHDTDKKVII